MSNAVAAPAPADDQQRALTAAVITAHPASGLARDISPGTLAATGPPLTMGGGRGLNLRVEVELSMSSGSIKLQPCVAVLIYLNLRLLRPFFFNSEETHQAPKRGRLPTATTAPAAIFKGFSVAFPRKAGAGSIRFTIGRLSRGRLIHYRGRLKEAES